MTLRLGHAICIQLIAISRFSMRFYMSFTCLQKSNVMMHFKYVNYDHPGEFSLEKGSLR